MPERTKAQRISETTVDLRNHRRTAAERTLLSDTDDITSKIDELLQAKDK